MTEYKGYLNGVRFDNYEQYHQLVMQFIAENSCDWLYFTNRLGHITLTGSM